MIHNDPELNLQYLLFYFPFLGSQRHLARLINDHDVRDLSELLAEKVLEELR